MVLDETNQLFHSNNFFNYILSLSKVRRENYYLVLHCLRTFATL